MHKDFLSLFDLEPGSLDELFFLADELRLSDQYRPLAGITAAMIFQKPSLRTRMSFELGIQQLGGTALFLPNESVGIGERESIHDVAKLLSRYVQLIIARTFSHSLIEELAAHASIPVVNALTDLSHPCQILSDMYTLREHGKLRPGVKVAYIGDGNNVANSWLEMASIYPMYLAIAAPAAYGPDAAILQRARNAGVSLIEVTDDPFAAASRADVLYTDVWTSMGQESEKSARLAAFDGFQVNTPMLKQAKGDAVVMHCLPAHRGEEIAAEVIDGAQSVIFDQAENRLHMQKALLAKLVDRIDRSTRAGAARSIHL